MNTNYSRPNSWEEEMEAPGWEETKTPVVSLVFSAMLGLGALLFVAVRTIIQTLFIRKSDMKTNPVFEISEVNR